MSSRDFVVLDQAKELAERIRKWSLEGKDLDLISATISMLSLPVRAHDPGTWDKWDKMVFKEMVNQAKESKLIL